MSIASGLSVSGLEKVVYRNLSVESLFSQYKHNAGGKMDSVNYSTA